MQLKYFVLGFFVAGFISCKKEQIVPLPLKDISNSANVKLVHASAYNTNYSVQLKVNNERITNAFTYSTPFPGGGLNTGGSSFPWYFALPQGSLNISMSVPKVGTGIDSIALFNGIVNVEANKNYSIYLSDTANKTQTTIVTDNLSLPQPSTTRMKFVNLIPNATGLDLYAGSTKVASDIAYKSVSPEFIFNAGDTIRFSIRPAGTAASSVPITMYPSLSPFAAATTVPMQRVMTVFSRGYVGATGTRAPAISLLYNK